MKDRDLINGLLNDDNQAYELLSAQVLPMLTAWIVQNNGTKEDAEELFQDSIVTLLHQINIGKYAYQNKLKWYLFTVQKNSWKKKLRKILKNRVTSRAYLEYIGNSDVEEANQIDDRRLIFRKNFSTLSAKCQELLNMRFKEISYEDIAYLLNYLNADVARAAKYRCIQRLIKRILEDPDSPKN